GMPLGIEAKPPNKGANICPDGNGTFYATKGNNKSGFYKYTVEDSTWTALADVPLGLSNKKVKGGTDMVYVVDDTSEYVYLLKGYKCEFYRYNVNSATWETLAEAPIGAKAKYDKGSWLVYDEPNRKIYAHKAKYQEMYTYSLDSLAWSAMMPGIPLANQQTGKNKKAKDGSDAVIWGGFIWTLKGGNTVEFYSYDFATATWTEKELMPDIGSTAKKKRVKGGGGITTDGEGLYALKGNKTAEMWTYRIGTAFGAAPTRSGVMAEKTLNRVGTVLGPNPLSTGYATLRYVLPKAGPAMLRVFDVTGRTVSSQSLVAGRSGTASLDLRSLSAGIYLVKLESEGYSSTHKLVVQR
ncbi:MAG: T9SS type A sorting domain-containing protein, partial [bacterium]